MIGVFRVLIADSHPVTREGLGVLVRTLDSFAVIDNAASIAEAETLARCHNRYRLVVLDDDLPDAQGFTGFLRIQHALTVGPIAVISDGSRPEQVDVVRALGAAGYLNKTEPLETLKTQLRQLADGACVFPGEAAGPCDRRTLRARLDTLSRAQLRTLLASADGRSNKQIAGELGVSEATIKAHLGATFRKLGVQNRVQALLLLQPIFGQSMSGSDGLAATLRERAS